MVLIAICGISGAGKSTLINFATSSLNNMSNMIPVTNRPPRPMEQNGIDRFFLDTQQMQQLEKENQLCLINEVYCYKYGYFMHDFQGITPKFIELHHKYLYQLNFICPQYISVCIEPIDILITREFLLNRQTSRNETNIRIQQLEIDAKEIDLLKSNKGFDYVFVNDYSERAKVSFLSLVKSILEC